MNQLSPIRLHVVIALLVLAISFKPAAVLCDDSSSATTTASVATELDACSQPHALDAVANGGKKYGTPRTPLELEIVDVSTFLRAQHFLSERLKRSAMSLHFAKVALAGGNRAPPSSRA